MSTPLRRVPFIGVLIFSIFACNMPSITAPTPDALAAFTAAAQTVAAAVSQTLVAPASQQPSPVEEWTTTPSFTPSPTLTPTITFTSTSAIVTISVSVDTNCRIGPGKVYDLLGGLFVGETAEVFGKNASGTYWYVRLPNSSTYCWVTGQYATLLGNVAFLPIYTPPPTPTPAPSFDISFAGMDNCVGWWVEFKLKNTSLVTFQSMAIVVKDLDTGTTLTDFENGFTDLDGCLASGTTPNIGPNESYIISSPAFVYNPNNHSMRAAVTLCTLPSQGGQCVTNSINFKP